MIEFYIYDCPESTRTHAIVSLDKAGETVLLSECSLVSPNYSRIILTACSEGFLKFRAATFWEFFKPQNLVPLNQHLLSVSSQARFSLFISPAIAHFRNSLRFCMNGEVFTESNKAG